MAPLRIIAAILFSLGLANGFNMPKPTSHKTSSSLNIVSPEVYEDAQKNWEAEFGPLAPYGWGPSVQAEKWNGRHAMFGWVVIVACAYAKGHAGAIPDADTLLNLKEWGALAIISGKTTISTERAAVLAANMHFFGVSLMATICPSPFMDPLLLDPNHPKYEATLEANSQPFGYLPSMKPGLNAGVEMWHGRFAMVGITALVIAAATTGENMLDIVNTCVGGLYY